jgi:rfaE bifunctional protein kinase chain/domain
MNFQEIFDAKPSICVVGDLMLDEWIFGAATRISPEAPVPVVKFEERKTAPGGAANVAMNLLSLGAKVSVGGIVGDDEAGRDLQRELESAGATTSLQFDETRPTTLKTRIMAQRQQLVRIDRESESPIGDGGIGAREKLVALIKNVRAICLSDYDKGLAECGTFQFAIEAAKANSLLVTAGPKPRNMAAFRGADFVSLNHKEASEATNSKLASDEEIACEGEKLREQYDFGALCITRGGAGVSLFERGQTPFHIPAHTVEVFDVAGAGDTFLSAATLALAAGHDAKTAALLGNLAAACSVKHVGVVAVTPVEILELNR